MTKHSKNGHRDVPIADPRALATVEQSAMEALDAAERERVGVNWPPVHAYAVGDIVVWRPSNATRSFRMRVTARLPKLRYQGKCVEPDRDFAHVMREDDIRFRESGKRNRAPGGETLFD